VFGYRGCLTATHTKTKKRVLICLFLFIFLAQWGPGAPWQDSPIPSHPPTHHTVTTKQNTNTNGVCCVFLLVFVVVAPQTNLRVFVFFVFCFVLLAP
jgi:hypothetical protein